MNPQFNVITRPRKLDTAAAHAQLFVALTGANFDGHDHVPRAAELGVRAALVGACSGASASAMVHARRFSSSVIPSRARRAVSANS